MKPNSAIFYRGPSMLTGDPIVAVVTGLAHRSGNRKTGPDMLQSWILRSDMPPNIAVATGADEAICGNCPLRSPDAASGNGRYNRACYVAWYMAPVNIWKALDRALELSPAALAPRLRGKSIRVGSYGDPGAVPFEVWDRALAQVGTWVGYTHQFKTCDQRLRDLIMASVESDAGADEAHTMGWRTFRARQGDILDPKRGLRADEVICPASNEAGHRLTCAQCGLCRGGASRSTKSIAILAHGRFASAVPA
jgi:hypothetical protein